MWNVETTDRFDEWFFEQTTALKKMCWQQCIFFLSLVRNLGGRL
ncbi:Uncharacterised protein [Enterobacter cloacae]|uniref:Uncharacterized protein n=1 Tax=Enterobacter cloacae TaxID=550 RepID=A0A377M4J4_ENTCL|nr:Uncharacterised protein [Enterobacter cloacae]